VSGTTIILSCRALRAWNDPRRQPEGSECLERPSSSAVGLSEPGTTLAVSRKAASPAAPVSRSDFRCPLSQGRCQSTTSAPRRGSWATSRPSARTSASLVRPPWLTLVSTVATAAPYRTSGQSNLTKWPHRRRTWTVQSYLPGGANVTPFDTCFLGPTRVHSSNGISICTAVFAQVTAESPSTLQYVPPHQSCPFAWEMWTPSNTWFLRPIQIHKPNGISIGSAVIAGLTLVTNRPTDRPRYSVCKNRPHLRT